MAEQLRSVLSQSSLQDYVDCPRRFQLRYLDGVHYPALESEPALENERHQQEGEYFHRLVQQSLLGLPEARLRQLANTENLRRWWDNFQSRKPDLDGYTIYPEASLSSPLGPVRLVAKYDLLALGDGKALIYDWKTYRKRPRDEWLAARLQTRVYRALLVRSGNRLGHGAAITPEQVQMVYWFADFPGEPAKFSYSAAQFERDWQALTALAQEITQAGTFPLTEDRQKCAFCPYRSYCDRGVTAGDLDPSETESGAESSFDLNFEQIGEIEF